MTMSSSGTERDAEAPWLAGPNSPTLKPSSPTLKVSAVAKRLGVSPATLRTWSRRYGLGPTGHVSGAHRRYTAQDVARLEMVRRLTTEGVSASEAARIAVDMVVPAITLTSLDPWLAGLVTVPEEAEDVRAGGDVSSHEGRPQGRARVDAAPADVGSADTREYGAPVVVGLQAAVESVDVAQWRNCLNDMFSDGIEAGWSGFARHLGDWGERLSSMVPRTVLPLIVDDFVTQLSRRSMDAPGAPEVLVMSPAGSAVGAHLLAGAVQDRGVPALVAHPRAGEVAGCLRLGSPSVIVVLSGSVESDGADLEALRMMHDVVAQLVAVAARGRHPSLSARPAVAPALLAVGPGWCGVHLRGEVEQLTDRDEVLVRIAHVCG